MKRIIRAALAVSLTTSPALPASIIKTPGPNGSHDVTISGTINLDDEKTFEALVMGDGHDTIYLDGLGGNFFAGLQIGTIVHDRHFETRVKGTCASMCAYVWLAGTPRARGQGSGIGFHAVFAKDTLQETGGPNAVLGSYLTKLGMSYQAIGYMTAKHATETQWLTPEDAQTLGINVVMLDAITNPSPPTQTTAPAASLPEIHIPPLAVRRKAHPDWKLLGSETKEFTEIQESCKPYPADQVSLCWWQERDSWDWSVKHREKFPKDKFPDAQAKRFQCWEVAQPGMALGFTTYKNCVIAKN